MIKQQQKSSLLKQVKKTHKDGTYVLSPIVRSTGLTIIERLQYVRNTNFFDNLVLNDTFFEWLLLIDRLRNSRPNDRILGEKSTEFQIPGKLGFLVPTSHLVKAEDYVLGTNLRKIYDVDITNIKMTLFMFNMTTKIMLELLEDSNVIQFGQNTIESSPLDFTDVLVMKDGNLYSKSDKDTKFVEINEEYINVNGLNLNRQFDIKFSIQNLLK